MKQKKTILFLFLCFCGSSCAHKHQSEDHARVVEAGEVGSDSQSAKQAISGEGVPSDLQHVQEAFAQDKAGAREFHPLAAQRPEVSDAWEADKIAVERKNEKELTPQSSESSTGISTNTQDSFSQSTQFKLGSLKRVLVALPYANVHIVGSWGSGSEGSRLKRESEVRVGVVPVSSSIGGETPEKDLSKIQKCSAHFEVENQDLKLIESKNIGKEIVKTVSGAFHFGAQNLPNNFECRYEVTIESWNPEKLADIDLRLVRGKVSIERWKKPVAMEMEWGDIDVGSSGSLSVRCSRCTLSGEDVLGPLEFHIGHGNVGISGLESGVEGETLGDIVFQWKKLPPKAQVKLKSKAGDIALGLPRGIPLSFDLKTPRGEVYGLGENSQSSFSSGTSIVQAVAEGGNVRVYRP